MTSTILGFFPNSSFFETLPNDRVSSMPLVCHQWNKLSNTKETLESRYYHPMTPPEKKSELLKNMFLSDEPDLNATAGKIFQKEHSPLIEKTLLNLKQNILSLLTWLKAKNDELNHEQNIDSLTLNDLKRVHNDLEGAPVVANNRLTPEEFEKFTQLIEMLPALFDKHPVGARITLFLFNSMKEEVCYRSFTQPTQDIINQHQKYIDHLKALLRLIKTSDYKTKTLEFLNLTGLTNHIQLIFSICKHSQEAHFIFENQEKWTPKQFHTKMCDITTESLNELSSCKNNAQTTSLPSQDLLHDVIQLEISIKEETLKMMKEEPDTHFAMSYSP